MDIYRKNLNADKKYAAEALVPNITIVTFKDLWDFAEESRETKVTPPGTHLSLISTSGGRIYVYNNLRNIHTSRIIFASPDKDHARVERVGEDDCTDLESVTHVLLEDRILDILPTRINEITASTAISIMEVVTYHNRAITRATSKGSKKKVTNKKLC